MVPPYADLELAFRWHGNGSLDAGLRFLLSDQNVDRWVPVTSVPAFDMATLARTGNRPDAYAEALTRMVFRDEVAAFYRECRATAGPRPLHVRLYLDGPAEVHQIRWELLRDPVSESPLATTADVLFSRYLSNPDFRTVPWRTKRASRALVAIAAPSDIEQREPNGRRLAQVDVNLERSNARAALGDIETVWLDGREGHGRATLANIAEQLAEGTDILVLVCHGALTGDVPIIFLERSDGTVDVVGGRRLQEMVYSLPERPTLALLSSCQSASDGGVRSSSDEGELVGLGPRLAGAGIATVMAMQGNISMESARLFSERFFTELAVDGLVDRSVASARRLLRERDRPDWWIPVLFSRLRSGRSYFEAGFTGDAESLWDSLATAQRTERLIPVLGPGMSDEIIGSRGALASRWAEQRRMPIASHNRDDLAKVAQFLRVQSKSPGQVATSVDDYLRLEIKERVAKATDSPDDPFHGVDSSQPPSVAILEAGLNELRQDPGNAYRVVAAMQVPLYVTTNWTRLLEQALKHVDPPREPVTMYFPWNDRADWPEPEFIEKPTTAQPVVYHLFGRMEDPDSLVITEDDYFEWLTAWVAGQKLIPAFVPKSLVNRPLLFLGYQLDDWEFRVVFQGIKSIPSSAGLLPRNSHIGVQLSPIGHEVEPEAAQDYLESYFRTDNVGIYWADTRKFLDEYRAKTGLET